MSEKGIRQECIHRGRNMAKGFSDQYTSVCWVCEDPSSLSTWLDLNHWKTCLPAYLWGCLPRGLPEKGKPDWMWAVSSHGIPILNKIGGGDMRANIHLSLFSHCSRQNVSSRDSTAGTSFNGKLGPFPNSKSTSTFLSVAFVWYFCHRNKNIN